MKDDSIQFEKVSVADAKKKADAEDQKKEKPKLRDKNWNSYRGGAGGGGGTGAAGGANQPDIKELFPWVQELPPEVRPKELITQYARIANKLAKLWKHPI